MSSNNPQKIVIEPLMTRAQVAQALNVHINTVDNLRKEGKLRFVKFGEGRRAGVRFRPADIQAFMAGE
jgi:excisionase family DNA binding protein